MRLQDESFSVVLSSTTEKLDLVSSTCHTSNEFLRTAVTIATGQAIVRLDGRDNYLGKYGAPESHDRYQLLIAEWRLQRVEREGQRRDATLGGSSVLQTYSIEELIFRYWKFAKTYYVKDGRPSKELLCMKYALRP